jgi:hypothetical protein
VSALCISEPETHDWLANHGMNPMSMAREAFARFVVYETHRAAQIIGAPGVTLT